MGYEARGEGRLVIRKESFAALAKEISGTERDVSQADIKELFEDNGFSVEFDEQGNIDYVESEMMKTFLLDKFLSGISDFVEEGSQIEFTGEDGDTWVWPKKSKKPAGKAPVRKETQPAETMTTGPAAAEDVSEEQLNGYSLSYRTLDQIPPAFWQPVLNKEGKPVQLQDCEVSVDGNQYVFSYSRWLPDIQGFYGVEDSRWVNYESFFEVYEAWRMIPDRGLLIPAEKCTSLTKEQLSARVAVFLRILQLCTTEKVLRKIAAEYPKKKNGTFCKNRVMNIAWFGSVCLDKRYDESSRQWASTWYSYQLTAKAEDDRRMNLVLSRNAPVSMYELDNFPDLSMKTNLFSRL